MAEPNFNYHDYEQRDPPHQPLYLEVIEHLYSPRQFVRRPYTALRPGGILIVTTPYWGYLKNLLLVLTNRIDHALTSLWEGGAHQALVFQDVAEVIDRTGI